MKKILKNLSNIFFGDDTEKLRQKQEAYLSGASDLYELEYRQKQLDRGLIS